MKYIIFDDGLETAVVFDELLTHADIAGRRAVKFAGFCRLNSSPSWPRWETYGESVSLKKSSGPKDDAIITNSFRRSV